MNEEIKRMEHNHHIINLVTKKKLEKGEKVETRKVMERRKFNLFLGTSSGENIGREKIQRREGERDRE